MEIRLISVKEDYEKAFGMINQSDYHLSYYEFSLRHGHSNHSEHKLVGAFLDGECLGILSYSINPNHVLGKVLHIKEVKTDPKNPKAANTVRNSLLSFIETIALEERCDLVKLQYQHKEKLTRSIFDRFENYLKSLL